MSPFVHLAPKRSVDRQCVRCRKTPKEWSAADCWTHSEDERLRLIREKRFNDCRETEN
jgi:hypothetical protein